MNGKCLVENSVPHTLFQMQISYFQILLFFCRKKCLKLVTADDLKHKSKENSLVNAYTLYSASTTINSLLFYFDL